MNELFFVLMVLSLTAAAFFFFVKKDGARSRDLLLISIKLFAAWGVFSGLFRTAPALFAACAAVLCAALFIFSTLGQGLAGNRVREYVLFAASLVILFLFASGCSSPDSVKYPEVTGEIKLDSTPSGITAGEYNEVYEASEKSRIIKLYNTADKKVLTSIGAGYMPVDIKIYGKKLFSANRLSDSVTIHDLEKGTGINLESGGVYPSAIAYNQAKNQLYVANMGSNNVAIIDMNSATISVTAVVPTGKWPSDLYLAPDNRYLYVCCKYTNTVQILDMEKRLPVLTKIDTGTSPSQLVPLENKEIAIINEWEYAFNHMSSIIVFNRSTYALEYDILVEGGILRAALSKSRKYLYITIPSKDKVIIVDIKKRQTVREMIFKDDVPAYIAVSKDGATAYVAARLSKKLYSIALNDFR